MKGRLSRATSKGLCWSHNATREYDNQLWPTKQQAHAFKAAIPRFQSNQPKPSKQLAKILTAASQFSQSKKPKPLKKPAQAYSSQQMPPNYLAQALKAASPFFDNLRAILQQSIATEMYVHRLGSHARPCSSSCRQAAQQDVSANLESRG